MTKHNPIPNSFVTSSTYQFVDVNPSGLGPALSATYTTRPSCSGITAARTVRISSCVSRIRWHRLSRTIACNLNGLPTVRLDAHNLPSTHTLLLDSLLASAEYDFLPSQLASRDEAMRYSTCLGFGNWWFC